MATAADLHHAVDEALVLMASLVLVCAFAVASLLRDEPHGQLADVDRVVRVVVTAHLRRLGTAVGSVLVNQIEVDVVHHGGGLALDVGASVALSLDGSEASRSLRIVLASQTRVVV